MILLPRRTVGSSPFVMLNEPTLEGKNQSDRGISDIFRAVFGIILECDASVAERGKINFVVTDAVTHDDLAFR